MTESYTITPMKKNPYLNNLLGAFSTTLSSRIEQSIAEVGLRSHNAAAALVSILNHPDDSILVLQRALNLTHSGAVRLIDGLASDGLVERRRNEQDGRSVVLRLTPEGMDCARAVLAAREAITEEISNQLTAEQAQALSSTLEELLAAMTHSYESARRNCRFCHEGVCRPRGCPVEQAVKT